jgi:8-oxo-dGTP diphosphatase
VEEAREDDEVIRAAGGIVVNGDDVLLVHRPKYDDWSLPKGKCKRGESDEECALREVEEETGFWCEIVRPLGESRYHVLAGPKVVRWFLMRPVEGELAPSDEVDQAAWVPRASVPDVATFDVGVELLASL